MYRQNEEHRAPRRSFVDEAIRDLATLREEMRFGRQLSFHNGFPLSTATSSQKTPVDLCLSLDNLTVKTGGDATSKERRVSYPPLELVERLPSSRDLSFALQEDVYQIPSSSPSSVSEEEAYAESCQDSQCSDFDLDQYHEDLVIEIFPGVFKPLRPASETEKAWERGECARMTCCLCNVKLAVLLDCEFVVCPDCEAVLPANGEKCATNDCSLPSLQASSTSFGSDSSQADLVQPRGVGIALSLTY
jgi:hypothetical protein